MLHHSSSSVVDATYKDVLDKAATLLPLQCQVVLCADRGFADTHLMEHLRQLAWHWRIRIKSSFWIARPGRCFCKANRITLDPGEAQFWHHVHITEQRDGPVHLALARRHDGKEYWFVVSDEPTDIQTFAEYGLRFDIEENCLDDKSHGFQLESSLIRSAKALERLCLVLALTTPVSRLTRHGSRHPGQTPVGRSPLVSRPELSEDRLEVGAPGPQQGLRTRDQTASIRQSRS